MSIRTRCIKSLFAATLLLAAAAASAQDESSSDPLAKGDSAPSGAAMVADLMLARPLGFFATVLGTAVFVAGLPFEVLAGNVSDPARRLVGDPARYTFTRPLGEDVN